MILTIKKRTMEDVTVLELAGRIVMGRDAQDVEWQVRDLLAQQCKKIVFDLAGVTHMDSTGVGIVAMCAGHLRHSGVELRIAGATGNVEQVLKLTRIDKIVGFYPTLDAAVENFASPGGASVAP